MQVKLISCRRMILIGSDGRNAGKTTLAVDLIGRLRESFLVYALKATSVRKGNCPHGSIDCNACSEPIKGGFLLTEENDASGRKDTHRLLAAGADRVFWLRAERPCLIEGFKNFIYKVPASAVIICESNSLREVVCPGLFIMLESGNGDIRSSFENVRHLADITFDMWRSGRSVAVDAWINELIKAEKEEEVWKLIS
jgi:hypothetical protein